ncbi:hypothetical protein LIPSTDRAFT_105435 [Lipomyces starkeyi NRRL Y-11557]|uniref:Uncharacterized protein n=1 Tax=Lipomyces starkeyi NRRL Y-11557 TaxID=675824 RepID=A0A1E3Q5G1_LIPST|nr:hypothetical protein LIPSTDRAFT_105435 [Lipomyces starkeyi NRRL Y-11557]
MWYRVCKANCTRSQLWDTIWSQELPMTSPVIVGYLYSAPRKEFEELDQTHSNSKNYSRGFLTVRASEPTTQPRRTASQR